MEELVTFIEEADLEVFLDVKLLSLDTNEKSNEMQQQVKKMLEGVDLRQDGSLSYTDFITAGADHKKLLTKENIEKVFLLLDANKDGEIDVEDLKKGFSALYRL